MAHALPRRARVEYIPLEVRRIVLHQRNVLRYTPAHVCASTDLPLRAVQRVCQRWDELCVVLRQPHMEGPVRVMKDMHIKLVLAILARSPEDLHLEELRDELWYRRGVKVPLSTLDYNLKELDIAANDLSERAYDQTLDSRISYLIEAGAEAAERLVFVDEPAVNVLTTYRDRAHGDKVTDFARGDTDRYAVLPALSLDGLLWIGTGLGSFDKRLFLEVLDGLLARMSPWPEKNSVLVLGTCASQHTDIADVRKRCAARGVRLIVLPPYARELNPTEDMFSSLRTYVQQHGARLRGIVKTDDHHRVVSFLLEALNEVVRPDSIATWFRKYKRCD